MSAYEEEAEVLMLPYTMFEVVDEPAEMEKVASCTVRTVAERMLGRELHRDEYLTWVPELAQSFAEGGYDYTALVREVATSEVYRTIR